MSTAGDLAGVATGARRLAVAWLALGVSALAVAGLFAILLVLARTPGLQQVFPAVDFFRTALVVHVDQSVIAWFLAFAGFLWSLLGLKSGGGLGWSALAVAATGCALIALAPWMGAAAPLMNNYVPVLRHPLFFLALGLFGTGVLLQAGRFLASLRPASDAWAPLRVGMSTVAVAVLAAGGTLLWTWGAAQGDWRGEAYYEYLFWGPGHVLQFAYTQLMLVAWVWLARAQGVRLGLPDRWLAGLLILGVAPLALVPVVLGLYAPDSGDSVLAFTRIMQFGNALAAVPLGAALLIGLLRRRPAAATGGAAFGALVASLLLFAVGGVLGALIAGVNTVIPAHYHGSIVGVTLSLMGLTYHLLPTLGFSAPLGRLATWQPWVYASGQLLHVSGLAISGAMGIQRKTAGSAQVLEGWGQKAAMGVMGLGGLLAVIGGILFVVVVGRALARPNRSEQPFR